MNLRYRHIDIQIEAHPKFNICSLEIEEALKELESDFAAFAELPVSQGGSDTAWNILISIGKNSVSSKTSRPRFAFSFRDARAFNWGRNRRVQYADGSGIQINDGLRTADIWASNPVRLRELSYLYIHHRLGLSLDELGFHRVHALGICDAASGDCALIIMNAGAGKTTRALSLAQFAPARYLFYSDEMPLISGRKIYPLPIRVSTCPETLAALDTFSHPTYRVFKRTLYQPKYLIPLLELGAIAKPSLVTAVLIGSRSPDGTASIGPASRLRCFVELFKSMVLGLGMIQIVELTVRLDFGRVFSLARSVVGRITEALVMSVRTPVFEFRLGTDWEKNVRLLNEFWMLETFPNKTSLHSPGIKTVLHTPHSEASEHLLP